MAIKVPIKDFHLWIYDGIEGAYCVICKITLQEMIEQGKTVCPGCHLEEHRLYDVIGQPCPCYKIEYNSLI